MGVQQISSLTLLHLFASSGDSDIRTAVRLDTSLTLCLLFASGQRGVGGGWCIRTATGLFTDFTPPHYAFQSKSGTLREQQDTSLAS